MAGSCFVAAISGKYFCSGKGCGCVCCRVVAVPHNHLTPVWRTLSHFSVERITSCNAADSPPLELDQLPTVPLQTLSVTDRCPIYSLSFHKDFLIVGLNGEICGFQWSSKAGTIGKKAWTVKLPAPPESADMSEVNYMWLNAKDDMLYAGCGDNVLYGVSLEDGKVCREFHGHTDYIHCVSGW